jgi:hypothetical protein
MRRSRNACDESIRRGSTEEKRTGPATSGLTVDTDTLPATFRQAWGKSSMRLHHHGEQSNPSQPCSRAEKPVIRPVFRLSKRIPIPVFERDFKPRVLLGDGAFYKFSLATRVFEVVITKAAPNQNA